LDADLGDEVTVATDARRKEVYGASYRANGPDDVTRIGDFYAGPPAGLPIAGRLFGDVELYPDVLHGERGGIDPACMARIARARAAAGAEQPTEPLYLRRPDAQVPSRLSRATTPGGAGTTGSPSAAPPSKETPSGG
ncbi:MAG: hypothetical protein Q4G64_01055, partial [bacterium]|nr:hypothetical protein [bacterium]